MSEGHIKLSMGEQNQALPLRTTHIQSASSSSEPGRAPKYHNLEPATQLIGPPNEARLEVNGVTIYIIIDTGAQITIGAYSFVRQL